MSIHRIAKHNVVGVFPDFATASEALDALAEAGFETQGELSLLGPDHEMRPAVDHIVDGNGEGASGTATGLVKGGTVGGVIGATVTTLGTVAATAIPGVGMAVGAAAAIGAVAGGILFGLAEQTAMVFFSGTVAMLLGFVLLIAVILIRPAGLFGVQNSR